MKYMSKFFHGIIPLIFLLSCNHPDITRSETGPIRLHPENPHFFLYQGKCIALISSGEHYGAVINQDFDYRKYLETLYDEGLNYTRIFTGTYFEWPGESFNIQHNTLAPEKDRVVTPWKVVLVNGKKKYDLNQWNDRYFQRLNDFMSLAEEKDIIVEITLFSSIYNDKHWEINPINPANNINIEIPIDRLAAQTLHNGPLLDYQINLVRKLVNELNTYRNFFFEIQNEPWADHPTAVYNIINKEDLVENDWSFKADFASETSLQWQKIIAETIGNTEKTLPNKHLIAQNFTNYVAPIPDILPEISIINFHYAWPQAAELNYHYKKVLGFDESGFAGSDDQVYRRQAWKFIFSGGGLFNNLDYSFYTKHEDGSGVNLAPGGGSRNLRHQLKDLSVFLHSLPLEQMTPDRCCIVSNPGMIPYVLSDRKKTFALYIRFIGTGNQILQIKTGKGVFRLTTLNPLDGLYYDLGKVKSKKGILSIPLTTTDGELALRIDKE